MLNDALNAFTQTTHGALIAEGKTPVVWGRACAVYPLNDGAE
jgi:hypothetical protein